MSAQQIRFWQHQVDKIMERVAIKGPFVQNRLTHFKSLFYFYTPMSPKNVRNRIFAWNGLKQMAMQKKKKKNSIEDFFSNCDQIRRKLWCDEQIK